MTTCDYWSETTVRQGPCYIYEKTVKPSGAYTFSVDLRLGVETQALNYICKDIASTILSHPAAADRVPDSPNRSPAPHEQAS